MSDTTTRRMLRVEFLLEEHFTAEEAEKIADQICDYIYYSDWCPSSTDAEVIEMSREQLKERWPSEYADAEADMDDDEAEEEASPSS